jgi:hypothetical protein
VCLFRSVKSRARNIKSGVPQGGVLLPILFNFFVADFPDHAPIKPVYTDDFNIKETSSDITTLEAAQTDDLVHVSAWADKNNLICSREVCHHLIHSLVAPTKSSTPGLFEWYSRPF